MSVRTRIILGVLAALLLLGGGTGAWIAFGPNTPDYEGAREITIPPGASFATTVASLEARGIIASRRTLALVGTVTGWRDQVKSGHYTFEAGASNYDILTTLRRGLQTPIRLTIPPGTRPEVVANVTARHMRFTPEEFLAALRDTTLATELETDTTHLFGYLLPETYSFYWGTPAAEVVRRAKREFDRFYNQTLAARADSIDLAKPEVVELAAIVEWEAHLASEKPRIAGVYLNRLDRGMPLQADPTVQYAVIQREGQKRRLLYEDYDLDHPYNTYNYRGLPPGPITNPSRSSLRAVVHAEEHDYLFFVANGEGGHTFSRTHREHVNAANEYRRQMRERRREQRQQDESSGSRP